MFWSPHHPRAWETACAALVVNRKGVAGGVAGGGGATMQLLDCSTPLPFLCEVPQGEVLRGGREEMGESPRVDGMGQWEV